MPEENGTFEDDAVIADGENAANRKEHESDTGSAGEQSSTRAERDEYLDRLQRLKAEFENYQKRIEREKKEWSQRTLMNFMADLLPILDDFQRAFEAATDEDGTSGFFQGVAMIRDQFVKHLESRGLEPIKAKGNTFDPTHSEAVMQEDDENLPDKTVLEELRQGYMLNGQVIRPAQVKLSRRPARTEDPSSDPEIAEES